MANTNIKGAPSKSGKAGGSEKMSMKMGMKMSGDGKSMSKPKPTTGAKSGKVVVKSGGAPSVKSAVKSNKVVVTTKQNSKKLPV